MVPGRPGVVPAPAGSPGLPGLERQPRRLAEPTVDRLGIALQGQGVLRDDMERLAASQPRVGQGLLECLGDVVGMDVVDGLQAEVRQGQFFATGHALEDRAVGVARRVDR